MARWPGRLFGPGLALAGVAVDVAFNNGALTLHRGRERPLQIAAGHLSLRRTGFNDSQLELAWQDGAGAWACHLSGRADIAALLAAWPPDLAQLTEALDRTRRSGLLPWTALVMLIALPLLLVFMVLAGQERVVDFIATQISPEVERQIGAAAMTHGSSKHRTHHQRSPMAGAQRRRYPLSGCRQARLPLSSCRR